MKISIEEFVNTSYMNKKSLLGILTFLLLSGVIHAQTKTKDYQVVTTAVPFLTLTPDSKSAAMGDAGVASTPDANAMYWNTSKLAFTENKFGASFSYAPWLRDIVQDMGLMSANGFLKVSDKQTIGASITYFDQGDIQFTNIYGDFLEQFHSKEFSVAVGIAQKLNSDFSMGLNLKFINSNLVGNTVVNGQAGKPGRTGAIDIGFYYNKNRPTDKNADKPKKLDIDYGLVLQNLGGKVNYGFGEYFIPANLKVGTKISHKPDDLNTFTFLLDINKLLVPTPIANSPLSDKSIFSTMFTSWSDAPGGFREEIQEVMGSLGAEYTYADLIALRTGYFYEATNKGGRQYFTTGFGITLKDIYKLDMAYLIPTKAGNPLANTWRISLNIGIPTKNLKSREVRGDEEE
jgi:hypothetical protein